jgi:tetratricopeptide (TPR) repeat protein
MRNPLPIAALVAALLTFATGGAAQAQQQSPPVPDAPQPQKKPAPKAQSSDSGSPPADQPASKPAADKDDNPFPQDVSRDAAKQGDDSNHSPAKDNPFPEDVSRDAAKPASGDDSKHPTANDNPFPEDVSRDAAKAAGNDSAPAPAGKSDLPTGVSSSRSSSSSADGENEIADPGRAKRDADVGGFYLKTGDYQGALLRYKDAVAADPTNVEAIYGLAETERMLKKNAEAAQNYQLYLEIVPNGPRSKQALKALKTLPPG